MPDKIISNPNVAQSRTKRVVAAATTNITIVLAGPGEVKGFQFYNTAAYDVFVKFYDKATAPVLATDVPKFVVPVKTVSGRELSIPSGINFAAGISYAITKGVADTDVVVTVAGDLQGAIFYR